MKYTFNPEDLTKERSLLDVYKLTKKIKINSFDFYFTLLLVILLSINAFCLSSSPELISSIRQWTPLVFGFTTTTLGFLITGFTIFATINKPELFLSLMEYKHPLYGISYLKYVYGVFMRVFIYFIFWSVIYLLVLLFGQENGLATKLLRALMFSHCTKVVGVQILYILVGSSAVFLVLTLKTFLFNIYAMLMQSLRWEVER
ncbi:TPA: hypothetical protein L9G83_003176 [Klebsiella pneumoniae]|uniref:hypothetical protein n=1 Tax=Klebsiella pneumoniae TaxID=573 RepID=UPI000E2E07B0|nr:hypothetical protein [Klebsiella pneumoniae]HDS9602942.1 hypothetical protein [Klebsiella pneumoniae subsp. pneumoniae]EKX7959133.1 hypothetical protein [Klebsiella pneumoniae]MBC4871246.1 hypothetical protein [Klebsiella pneumoniae]MBV0568370.1 hypothetical protein [Klebsiella pneumoniae]MCA5287171.1 hypothetical protein [Klebsiella pneumoniae]